MKQTLGVWSKYQTACFSIQTFGLYCPKFISKMQKKNMQICQVYINKITTIYNFFRNIRLLLDVPCGA
jgi:hypothetical protein